MVPNGWSENILSDLCEKIGVGLAISVTPYMRKAGTKLIRNQNIKRNYFNSKSVVYIDDDFAEKNQSKRVYVGDVVAVRTGSNIGEACVVPKEFDGALTFTTLIARPIPSKLSSEYLGLHINSEKGISEVNRLMAGGGKPNLNSGELKKYKLLTPTIEEQRKIASILGTWSKAINTTERLIGISKQQKKALMQQLLIGRKRLLDDSDKPFSDGWNKITMETICCRVIEKNNKKSKNVVTISAQHGLIRQQDYFKKVIASETLDNYFILRKGQFAYNKSYSNGYPMGAIKRLNRYEDGVVTSLYICFDIVDVSKTDPNFLEHYFESGLLNRGLTRVAAEGGRAHGLLNVKPSDFMALELVIPCYHEQQKIAAALTISDKEIELLENQVSQLKQEKKALMQQLLTGKKRVIINIEDKEVAC